MNNLNIKKFQGLISSSYVTNKEASKIGKKFGLRMQKQLSNAHHKVFLDSNDNPFIVYTGSKDLISDGLTDVALAVGLHGYTSRFKDSKVLASRVRDIFQKPLTLTGHSLGGSLSEYSSKPGDNVYTLDKGVGITGIGKKLNTNQRDFRAKNDVISFLSNWQRGGHKIDFNSDTINPLLSHDKMQISKIQKDYWNMPDARENTNSLFRHEL